MKRFKVFDENWKNDYSCETKEEAEAYRYQKYGYAGYIIEYDANGHEAANHS